MEITASSLNGPLLIEPEVRGDERGFFLETFRADQLAAAGVDVAFVQDNHSRSLRGVVRGMHFQPGQAKLIRCVRGAIFDVIVDVRVGSPSFGRWEGFELNDETHHQLFIPNGFAHGFCVLTEIADIIYKVSDYYSPATEGGFGFGDPAVAIEWPLAADAVVASARDLGAPTLAELQPTLPFRYV